MRAEARQQGLWALQMPKARGGGGLSMAELAACYEEMNRSIFGPVVFNAAAPDDGNMIVLEKVAPEAQKARWLQPIVDGEVQSAFAMTEPDGCGSDPSLTYTRAERRGNDRWVVARPQALHHRRRRGEALHPHRPHLATTTAGASPPSCSTPTARAGGSSAASRSWGRRSMAGIASWSSTGWRSPTRTG